MRAHSKAVEEHLRMLTIICFAIMSGVALFGGVVWYLVNVGAFAPSMDLPSVLPLIANILALVMIVKAHFLARFYPPPGPAAPEEALLAWHKRNTILGFAIREGAAFIALIGVLLTGQQTGGFAMAVLALLSMVFAWPRAEQLETGL
jgi:hypothetical protein